MSEIVKFDPDFQAMQLDLEELKETLSENLGDGGLSAFDFDHLKIPSGGGTSWEVPTLEGFDDQKAVEGIVVAWKDSKAYWAVPFDESGGGSPPDCYSDDLIMGIGEPGGACATCPFNQFESAAKGKGKACKDIRTILLLREDDILPLALNVPPTSIGIIKKIFLRLASHKLKFHDVVIRFELEKDKSDGGITYSKLKLSIVGPIPPEKRQSIKSYVDHIRPVLNQTRIIDILAEKEEEEGEVEATDFSDVEPLGDEG